MANSLSDQLLRAGLITQEQIDKAEQDRQQRKVKAKSGPPPRPDGSKGKKPQNRQGKPGKDAASAERKPSQPSRPAPSGKKPPRSPSDLEQFYRQRSELERAEREAEEQQRREAAKRRKATRKQLRELIAAHALNTEEAAIRFNFVVGETVKYLFVTEQQQQELASGQLSITFMDGKRCLVPQAIGLQILELDPEKIVVNFTETGETEPLPDIPETVATDAAQQETTTPEATSTPEATTSDAASNT
ncbi:MAG: DUF2058 family protein [Thiolinea sp.]